MGYRTTGHRALLLPPQRVRLYETGFNSNSKVSSHGGTKRIGSEREEHDEQGGYFIESAFVGARLIIFSVVFGRFTYRAAVASAAFRWSVQHGRAPSHSRPS